MLDAYAGCCCWVNSIKILHDPTGVYLKFSSLIKRYSAPSTFISISIIRKILQNKKFLKYFLIILEFPKYCVYLYL